MLKMLIIHLLTFGILQVATATKPPGYVEKPKIYDPNPPKYDFGYTIDYSHGKQGRLEQRDGEHTQGHYYVDLPEESAAQEVRYFADDWGFHPIVKYSSRSEHGSTSTHLAIGEEAIKRLSSEETQQSFKIDNTTIPPLIVSHSPEIIKYQDFQHKPENRYIDKLPVQQSILSTTTIPIISTTEGTNNYITQPINFNLYGLKSTVLFKPHTNQQSYLSTTPVSNNKSETIYSKLVASTQNLVSNEDLLNINGAVENSEYVVDEKNIGEPEFIDVPYVNQADQRYNIGPLNNQNIINIQPSKNSYLLSGSYGKVANPSFKRPLGAGIISIETTAEENNENVGKLLNPIIVADIDTNTENNIIYTTEKTHLSENQAEIQNVQSTTQSSIQNINENIVLEKRPVSQKFLAPLTAGIRLISSNNINFLDYPLKLESSDIKHVNDEVIEQENLEKNNDVENVELLKVVNKYSKNTDSKSFNEAESFTESNNVFQKGNTFLLTDTKILPESSTILIGNQNDFINQNGGLLESTQRGSEHLKQNVAHSNLVFSSAHQNEAPVTELTQQSQEHHVVSTTNQHTSNVVHAYVNNYNENLNNHKQLSNIQIKSEHTESDAQKYNNHNDNDVVKSQGFNKNGLLKNILSQEYTPNIVYPQVVQIIQPQVQPQIQNSEVSQSNNFYDVSNVNSNIQQSVSYSNSVDHALISNSAGNNNNYHNVYYTQSTESPISSTVQPFDFISTHIKDSGSQENNVGNVIEKHIPIPYLVEKKVPVTVEKRVPILYSVPTKVSVPIEVEKIVEKPVEVIKYVDKPYPVEVRVHQPVPVPIHIHHAYAVDRIVEKNVPYPVPVEKIVEKKVPFEVKVPYPVEKIVEKIIEKPVPFTQYIEKPYPVATHIPVPVEVEKIVEKKVPYPVEVKVPYRVEVPKPVPYAVEKIVEKPVPYVPKFVGKSVSENNGVSYSVDNKNVQISQGNIFSPLLVPTQNNLWHYGWPIINLAFNDKSNVNQNSGDKSYPKTVDSYYRRYPSSYADNSPNIVLNSKQITPISVLDSYIGPVPLREAVSAWNQDAYSIINDNTLKYRRSDRSGKNLRVEYGFKPPLIPSIEIDLHGRPINKS